MSSWDGPQQQRKCGSESSIQSIMQAEFFIFLLAYFLWGARGSRLQRRFTKQLPFHPPQATTVGVAIHKVTKHGEALSPRAFAALKFRCHSEMACESLISPRVGRTSRSSSLRPLTSRMAGSTTFPPDCELSSTYFSEICEEHHIAQSAMIDTNRSSPSQSVSHISSHLVTFPLTSRFHEAAVFMLSSSDLNIAAQGKSIESLDLEHRPVQKRNEDGIWFRAGSKHHACIPTQSRVNEFLCPHMRLRVHRRHVRFAMSQSLALKLGRAQSLQAA